MEEGECVRKKQFSNISTPFPMSAWGDVKPCLWGPFLPFRTPADDLFGTLDKRHEEHFSDQKVVGPLKMKQVSTSLYVFAAGRVRRKRMVETIGGICKGMFLLYR
ncbi:hypothetical protein TNIN_164091 [Trichonephila inaurata madagascariensis]|uniref:Uncharacterized protein n=1 Tax=Trichonephila inaurata madagascariensis TaxID=2747483 RepID=A0A8X6X4Z4_9ARAC|nr:hypothetical protein TNIN_164091 [Trichonephila inaurata madagascariensis]